MSRADETVMCGQPLTNRERQVLSLIYRARAVKKLGARSGTHAVAIAISRGIVPALLG